jgi:hypothetical protein
MLFAVVISVIPGCFLAFDEDAPSSGMNLGDKTSQATELQGPHYAKLNSIGCLVCNDMEIANAATHKRDFDTIDNLVREKRCFVIPTDADIYINERVRGDIVSVRLKGSTQSFYTVRSTLVAK